MAETGDRGIRQTLYHYCTNSACVAILTEKQIRVSELSLSNDLMEGRWVREVLIRCCRTHEISDMDQSRLLEHLDSIIAMFGGAGFCMSQEGDLLSQWRAYADNGAGVSIGFDALYFEELGKIYHKRNGSFGLKLVQIEYDPVQQDRLAADQVANIKRFIAEGALRGPPTILNPETEEQAQQRRTSFENLFVEIFKFFPHMYSLKNPAFAEEREFRLLSYVIRAASNDGKNQLSEMDFRAANDRIVPFNIVGLEALSRSPIKEVILGPRNITPEPVVNALLRKSGLKDVLVRRSSASYR